MMRLLLLEIVSNKISVTGFHFTVRIRIVFLNLAVWIYLYIHSLLYKERKKDGS